MIEIIFLGIITILLVCIAVFCYCVHANQLRYFKESLANWEEMIKAIKELSKYVE